MRERERDRKRVREREGERERERARVARCISYIKMEWHRLILGNLSHKCHKMETNHMPSWLPTVRTLISHIM
jgi:hypothetical protein